MRDTPRGVYYLVTPSVGIYLVLVGILLHCIGTMESTAVECMHAGNSMVLTTSRYTTASTTPLPNGDARSTAIVLHSMVAHNGMSTAGLYQ